MADAFFTSLRSLERGLDQSVLRTSVIQNNIANVDTPYFQRSYVPFGEVLSEKTGGTFVGRRTRTGHRNILESDDTDLSGVIKDETTKMRYDENNVDIENEMTELARNQIYYDAAIRKLNGQFTRLRTAITAR